MLKYLILTLFTLTPVLAAQFAVVKRDKAVIYADQNMSSALGYAKRGRKLTVGKKPLKGGKLLRIIVSGKMAYIKRDDLTLEQDTTDIEAYKNKVLGTNE